MKLSLESIRQDAVWRDAGFVLPAFDIPAMRAATEANPQWVHFGSGNIFRALLGAGAQTLLEKGVATTGIIACGGFDGDVIDATFRPFDNLSVLVVMRSDGTVEKRVIASVAKALRVDGENPADDQTLRAIFRKESLQLCSFTITEKGYQIRNGRGYYFPWVQQDLDGDPRAAKSLMGKIASLLLERYEHGAKPIALVSMDNCSHNGAKLRASVLCVCKVWTEGGAVEEGFYDYVSDENRVSFPWSMIDKITPRPDARVAEALKASGFEDYRTIVTPKNAHTAAFVNAEAPEYLVIEDHFPAGRPAFEAAGYYMTDRETVERVEQMKVSTCLNPLHTALAVLGCLLGFGTIYQEMQDDQLRELVNRIAYDEGMPVVVDPGILSPMQFADEVINTRFSNPFMPDTPQRIATDTSQKLAIRYGETIKAYLAREDLDVHSLKLIPFVFAAWLRYLLGLDDALEIFEPSPDPMLETLRNQLSVVCIGAGLSYAEVLQPILENEDIFGVDLRSIGLDKPVVHWFDRMTEGRGAVREALTEVLES